VSIVITILFLLAFNYLLLRFDVLQFKSFRPEVTLLLFNMKFLAGLSIWWVYTFYYTDTRQNDVYKFYRDAEVINTLLVQHPSSFFKMLTGKTDEHAATAIAQTHHWNRKFDRSPFNENRLLITMNAIWMMVSFKTYPVHILLMCFLSLIGWVLLVNAVFDRMDSRQLFAIPIMMIPSVLFWNSGITKEPILIFGLGLLLNGLFIGKKTLVSILCFIVGSLLIAASKVYVLLFLLPAVGAHIFQINCSIFSRTAIVYLVSYLLCALVVLSAKYLLPSADLLSILAAKQSNAIREALFFKAGSRVSLPEINGVTSLPFVAGKALVNVFFRPFIWEAKNPMMFITAIEKILLSLIFMLGIIKFHPRHVSNKCVFFTLLFTSFCSIVLGGMITPVLGNLVRYTAPILPLLLFALTLSLPVSTVNMFDSIKHRLLR
jgi:hypothetical protein